MSERPSPQASGSSGLFASVFSIDTRTLALFRVVLGTLVLLDGIARAQHLGIHYSATGIIPLWTREAFEPGFSLHWLSESIWFHGGLMLVRLAAAVALIVGYRTRVAAFVCWILLTSLHFRSPYLNDGGDAIARMMLFWSIFLPLGERFGVEAKRRGREAAARVFSTGTVAILVQFLLFYFVAGMTKNGPGWVDGSAVAAAIDNSYWSEPFGDRMLGYPELLKWLTWGSRGLEIVGPLLLFIPFFTAQIRIATILSFWLFQFGLWMCLELNFFPFFSTTATLVFIPGLVWDRFFPSTRLESTGEADADASSWIPSNGRGLAEAGLLNLLLLASILLASRALGWLDTPRMLNNSARYVGFEQAWTMYAPHPPPYDLHFRVLGHRPTGEILPLVASDDPIDHGEAWQGVADFHTGYRIKDHLEHLMFLKRDADPLRQSYLAWMCHTWNGIQTDQPIDSVAYVAVGRPTLTDRSKTEPPRMMAERACDADAATSD